MSLRDRAIRGAGWSILATGGNQVAGFVVLMTLASLLGPDAFGLVAFASIFAAFLAVFLSFGFGEALIQRQDVEPEHIDTAFWTVLASGCGLALLGQGLALTVAWAAPYLQVLVAKMQTSPGENFVLSDPELVPVIQVLSLGFIVASLRMLPDANLRREMRFKALGLRTLTASVIGGAIGIGMALYEWGIWSLVGHRLSTDLIATALLWPASRWRPRLRYSVAHFHHLFAYGRNILGTRLLTFANRWIDHLLIGLFIGTKELGYYTVASRAVIMMRQLLLQSVQRVALPTFSRLQDDPPRLRRAIYMATQGCSIVAFPAFLGIAALAPEFVEAVDARWLAGAPVARMLAILGIVNTVNAVNGAVMLGLGKPNWVLWLRLMNVTANVIAFALVVKWGIVAVATAFVVRGYLLAPIQLLMMQRLSGINMATYFRQFVPPLVAALALVVTALGVRTVTQADWHKDTAYGGQTIDPHASYDVHLVLDGSKATLRVDGDEMATFDFQEPITDGALGLGTENARAHFDNVIVQSDDATRLFEENFTDRKADSFVVESAPGSWSVRKSGLGVYEATPSVGKDAIATIQIANPLPKHVELLSTIYAEPTGGGHISNAMLIFDYHGPTKFKFAGAKTAGDKWVIGHCEESLGLYATLALAIVAGGAVYLVLICCISPFVRQQLVQFFRATPAKR